MIFYHKYKTAVKTKLILKSITVKSYLQVRGVLNNGR